MSKLTISQKLEQRTGLSTAQIQALEILTLQAQQLEQKIEREVVDNPALEKVSEDEEQDTTIDDYIKSEDHSGSYRTRMTSSPDAEAQSRMLNRLTVDSSTLSETLKDQLVYLSLTEKERDIALFIIGSIDGDGYLRKYNQNISDDLLFTQNIDASVDEIEAVVKKIQTLEPAGVAARDLRECLLIQLRREENTPAVGVAIKLLENYYDHFINKRYDTIIARTGLSQDDLREAISEITSLNPRPSNGFSDDGVDSNQVVTPDFFVEYNPVDDSFNITLAGEDSTTLRINRSYVNMAKNLKRQDDKESKEAMDFITRKIKSAQWFISIIKQRQETLKKTMGAIIARQREFFIEGNSDNLRPMVLKDIAEDTGLDVSTIWRVVDSKYVQTNFGIFSLKNFFSGGYTTSDGTEVTSKNVKNILKSQIDSEDPLNPLTDQQLMEILKNNGYDIARRTIAKYREQLGLPVARLRRKL